MSWKPARPFPAAAWLGTSSTASARTLEEICPGAAEGTGALWGGGHGHRLLTLVGGLGSDDRARQVSFLGLTTDLERAITLMAADLHEHLGQAIPYARMNRIVPPWSLPGG